MQPEPPLWTDTVWWSLGNIWRAYTHTCLSTNRGHCRDKERDRDRDRGTETETGAEGQAKRRQESGGRAGREKA